MTSTYDYDVAIVGGGPVGMLLASELRLADVATVVIERLSEPSPHSKAFGLHARSMESLDRRGLAERFRDGARTWNNGHFAGLDVWVDFSVLDSNHAYALLSEQTRTEALLEEHARESGAAIRRGCEARSLTQTADGVELEVAGPDGTRDLRVRYVVGCDGGASFTRKAAGIPFPGSGGQVTARLGDVVLADRENAPMGMERTERGLLFCVPLDERYHRVATFDFASEKRADEELSFDELRASMREIWGSDLGARSPRWLSWFTDSARQAERYREGRVLLAGDAAHTHFPVGGQGLNLGLQDAFNLGWKLAGAVHGWAPDDLLDSYDAERQPPARRVLANTRAQIALMNPDPYVTDLRQLFETLMGAEQVNKILAETLSGVNVRYDLAGTPHRLLGQFAPELSLRVDDAKTSLSQHTRHGGAVLLDLSGRPELDETAKRWAEKVAWPGRVTRCRATCEDEEGLAGVLVRPDGYVAWAVDEDVSPADLRESLSDALATWLGSR